MLNSKNKTSRQSVTISNLRASVLQLPAPRLVQRETRIQHSCFPLSPRRLFISKEFLKNTHWLTCRSSISKSTPFSWSRAAVYFREIFLLFLPFISRGFLETLKTTTKKTPKLNKMISQMSREISDSKHLRLFRWGDRTSTANLLWPMQLTDDVFLLVSLSTKHL